MSVTIHSPADLEANAEALAEFTADWGPQHQEGGRMDWESFVDRLERNLDWDLPTDWSDPVWRPFKKVVKATLAEMGE